MFDYKDLLSSKGPLRRVWLAAFCREAALSRDQVARMKIVASVDEILKEKRPLRILAQLLFGIVRIYSKKVEYLHHDYNQLKCSFQPRQFAEHSAPPTRRSSHKGLKQANKAVHAVRLVVGQQNTSKVKKSIKAVGTTEVPSTVSSEGISVSIETEGTIRTSVVIREASFMIPKRFELDSFDLGVAEDTDDEGEDHHQLAWQDTLLEDQRHHASYLYESYQRASCSYGVDSACFMPEYIALPSNILDLTEGDVPERENQNADSAWFTPVKDVLPPELMMDTVAEVKDRANKSKSWNNSIREVNMDENIGGSACSMTSIPLQEIEEGQNSQNVLENMTYDNLSAKDCTNEASENDSLLGKSNTAPTAPGFPEYDTEETESLEPPVLSCKTRVETELSPSTPEPLPEGTKDPGPYSSPRFRVRTPAKAEKSQTSRKRKRLLYSKQDYIPKERENGRRVRRRLTWSLYDEAIVLPDDMMRRSIEDASGLVQKRRKAPHTHLDTWKVAKLGSLQYTFMDALIPYQTSTPFAYSTAAEAPENSCEESVKARRRLSYKHSESINACKDTGSAERESINASRKRKLDEQTDFEVPVVCHTESGPVRDEVYECNGDAANEKSAQAKGNEPNSKEPTKKGLHNEALNDVLANIDEDIPVHEEHTKDEGLLNSTRTRKIASCLHQLFMDQKSKEGTNSLSLNQVLEGTKRKVSATFFYETLVLKSRGFVEVNQEKPYEDIILSETPQLEAELQRCGN